MQPRTWHRAGIRTVLFTGFGLTFGIWLFAGNYFLNRIAETERQTAAVYGRYMQAQELLSNVRAQVFLGSIYVRDALLDPNPNAAEYLSRFEQAYGSVDQAIKQYVPVLDSPAERDRVERLKWQLEDYRKTMRQVLGTNSTRWASDARVMLRTLTAPKRDLVIRVSEEVQSLNRIAFLEHQREIAQIYAASQRRLWQTLGVALAASFGIAVLVAVHAGRLQSRLEDQREREARTTRELQELSAKLITAQEEERRSISRELHDEVGQALSAIKVELAVAERALEGGGGARVLQDARSITEGALTTVRDLSHLLHPALLDDLGLPAAVDWYVRGFSRRYDIRVDLSQEGMNERLAPEIEATAYRIVQEALTNVAKHARATACSIRLEQLDGIFRVTIDDDGVGFNPDASSEKAGQPGLGLIGMRERASQFGGLFRLETQPGRGTLVTVELPARPRGRVATVTAAAAATAPIAQREPAISDG